LGTIGELAFLASPLASLRLYFTLKKNPLQYINCRILCKKQVAICGVLIIMKPGISAKELWRICLNLPRTFYLFNAFKINDIKQLEY
jgi:hypothetical protein